MSKLKTLDLRSDQLSGPLPAEWGSLTTKPTIALTSNKLCGCVPGTWKGKITSTVDTQNSAATCATTGKCPETTTTTTEVPTTTATTEAPACQVMGCVACQTDSTTACSVCLDNFFHTETDECVRCCDDDGAGTPRSAFAMAAVALGALVLVCAGP